MRIAEKVNESSKWYARICRKQGSAKSKAFHSTLTVPFLWWQQNSQTDHFPRQGEFKVSIGDFITLPSAVFRIALLEAGLETEGNGKISLLDTSSRPGAQWGLWTITLSNTLLSRTYTGAALTWCSKKPLHFPLCKYGLLKYKGWPLSLAKIWLPYKFLFLHISA